MPTDLIFKEQPKRTDECKDFRVHKVLNETIEMMKSEILVVSTVEDAMKILREKWGDDGYKFFMIAAVREVFQCSHERIGQCL